MKYTFLLFTSIFVQFTFSQTNNTLEIYVDHPVELEVETIQIQLFMLNAEGQKNLLLENNDDLDSEYDFENFDFIESDWDYEQLLENSPEEVTDEMRAEYEEREKQREIARKKQEEQEKERARNIATFKAKTLNDLKTILDKNKFTYTQIVAADASNERMYGLFGDDDDYMTDAIQIDRLKKDDWIKLNDLLKDHAIVKQKVTSIQYRTIDNQLESIILQLTQRANDQAKFMAKSLNRKVGNVLKCSNVYPSAISPAYMNSVTGGFDKIMNERYNGYQAFSTRKTEIVQYIYTFELL